MIELKHFNKGTRDEFACKCGCGRGIRNMDHEFLGMIDDARDRAGFAFSIKSGYRCPAHNTNVGSTSINHVSGKAVDIVCYNSVTRLKMIQALLDAGFRRLGLHASFIHADSMDRVENGSVPCAWFY